MANLFDFNQVNGFDYLRHKYGWVDSFNIQSKGSKADHFYINYGVAVPELWSSLDSSISPLKGYFVSNRLNSDDACRFSSTSKSDIELSAKLAERKFAELAEPWFSKFEGLLDIAHAYFQKLHLNEESIGQHPNDYGYGEQSINYGLLLFRGGNEPDGARWLKEGRRILSSTLTYMIFQYFIAQRLKISLKTNETTLY